MYRQMPMWFGKHLSLFNDFGPNSSLEVSRIPATGNSPPCLKLTQKINPGETATQEKAKMEYIRLSMPVQCNTAFVRGRYVKLLIHYCCFFIVHLIFGWLYENFSERKNKHYRDKETPLRLIREHQLKKEAAQTPPKPIIVPREPETIKSNRVGYLNWTNSCGS